MLRSEHVDPAAQEHHEAHGHGEATQLRVNRWRAPFTFYTTTLKNLKTIKLARTIISTH